MNINGRMTREEFIEWLLRNRVPFYVGPNANVEPCECGDTNCHGWRLVDADSGRQ